jgi:hypothetical protein
MQTRAWRLRIVCGRAQRQGGGPALLGDSRSGSRRDGFDPDFVMRGAGRADWPVG